MNCDPVTTNPATGKEHKGLKCKRVKTNRNTYRGAVATCKKYSKCWAVEKKGRAAYCYNKFTKSWTTNKNGLINLEAREGKVVWIKGNFIKRIRDIIEGAFL